MRRREEEEEESEEEEEEEAFLSPLESISAQKICASSFALFCFFTLQY